MNGMYTLSPDWPDGPGGPMDPTGPYNVKSKNQLEAWAHQSTSIEMQKYSEYSSLHWKPLLILVLPS